MADFLLRALVARKISSAPKADVSNGKAGERAASQSSRVDRALFLREREMMSNERMRGRQRVPTRLAPGGSKKTKK
jgi:hypothetical protein